MYLSWSLNQKMLKYFGINGSHYFSLKTKHCCSRLYSEIWLLNTVDVSIPADVNMIEKDKEKILKYQDLRIELQKLWNIKLKVIPIILGSLGTYTTDVLSYLMEIPGSHRLDEVLKSALLGSASILRMVLDVQEFG